LIEFNHLDYFFNKIEQIYDPLYIPTDSDILRARQRTAGASSITVYSPPNFFELFEYGSRSNRSLPLEMITYETLFCAFFFFINLNKYDYKDDEDDTGISIFEHDKKALQEYENHIEREDAPLFLMLTKLDLFLQKIRSEDGYTKFKSIFPDYNGTNDENEALDYVKQYFQSSLKVPSTAYAFSNLDSDGVSNIWDEIHEGLIKTDTQKPEKKE